MVDIETPDIVVAKTGVKISPNANHAQVKAISDPSALQWSRDGSAVACAQDDKVIGETWIKMADEINYEIWFWFTDCGVQRGDNGKAGCNSPEPKARRGSLSFDQSYKYVNFFPKPIFQ